MALIVNAFALVAIIVAWIATYYLISYAVLWLVGKALPLAGRRQKPQA